MAKLKTSGRRSSSTRPRRSAAPQKSGSGAAIGIIGAVLAVAGLVGCIVISSSHGKKAGAIEQWKRAEYAKLRDSVPEQNQALVTRTKEIEAGLNASREAQQTLIQKVAEAQKELERLEKQVEPLGPEESKLKAELAAAEEKAASAGADSKETVAKLKELAAQREKLADYYVTSLNRIEDALRERLEKGPQAVKALFGQIRHTPFGPAALFQAAELYYAEGGRETAVNLYKQLIREFPDCEYVGPANAQISAAAGGQPFSASSAGVKPHRALKLRR
jgi:tetratricopeptide (TPR) repeat protein